MAKLVDAQDFCRSLTWETRSVDAGITVNASLRTPWERRVEELGERRRD